MVSDASAPIELPRKPQRGQQLDLVVHALGPRGQGVASLDTLLGPQQEARRIRFEVRGAVPGDRVRVVVRGTERRIVEADLQEVLDPGPDRVEPRCRHARRPGGGPACGGCPLQSLSYEAQLAAKEAWVRAELSGAGLDGGVVRPILGAPDPWYFRNKIELSFGPGYGGGLGLGFFPPGFKFEVLRLEECFLESPEALRLAHAVRDWAEAAAIPPHVPRRGEGFLRTLTLREGKRTGERLAELTTTAAPATHAAAGELTAEAVAAGFRDAVLGSGVDVTSIWWSQHRAVRGEPTRLDSHHLHGASVLHEELRLRGQPPLRFRVHPRAFFQPNTLQAEVLYEQVAELAGLAGAGDGAPVGTVLDLYCGTGTIGMTLARRARRVVGVELVPEAVAVARENAALNGLDNLELHVGDVRKVLRELELGAVDLVVVDPPRSGLAPRALARLIEIGAPRVVYVSCNPGTLAPNLADLVAAGWVLEAVQPVDLFPQTMHVENVALLRRPPAHLRPAFHLLPGASPDHSS